MNPTDQDVVPSNGPAAGPAVEDAGDEPLEPSGVLGNGFADPAADSGGIDAAQVVAERDAYLDDLKRVTAEFANFRRQTEKRNVDVVARAASRLVADLLPVLDACEAAASQGVEGMEAVNAQLLGVLCARGLSVLGVVDEPFDPNCHEAVMAEESGDADTTTQPVVAEVLRTGYGWQGRVLRAAMVKVRS